MPCVLALFSTAGQSLSRTTTALGSHASLHRALPALRCFVPEGVQRPPFTKKKAEPLSLFVFAVLGAARSVTFCERQVPPFKTPQPQCSPYSTSALRCHSSDAFSIRARLCTPQHAQSCRIGTNNFGEHPSIFPQRIFQKKGPQVMRASALGLGISNAFDLSLSAQALRGILKPPKPLIRVSLSHAGLLDSWVLTSAPLG